MDNTDEKTQNVRRGQETAKRKRTLHTHAGLIDDLGGRRKVAIAMTEAVGDVFSPETVGNWRLRGIPYKWRATFTKVAIEAGVSTPKGFFSQATNSGTYKPKKE